MKARQTTKGGKKRETKTRGLLPPIRLDIANAQAWQGERLLKLPPKAFIVLQYFSEYPGQLITKDELMRTVWSDTIVTDGALAACIRDVRKALGDKAQMPQYIETVHRRGYRWVAASAASVSDSRSRVSSFSAKQGQSSQGIWHMKRGMLLVGREQDLSYLHQRLAQALNGERQLIFVTGEPGIGKTTLVEKFLFEVRLHGKFGDQNRKQHQNAAGKMHQANIRDSFLTPNSALSPIRGVWVARGQCIEHYGAGEAYLPVLAALGRLCRGREGNRLIALLNQHAPTWLVQMSALLSASELEALQRKTQGATRERMLRELTEALEAITAERSLIFVLEDLHWSDPSTLDLLSMIARRLEPARLLLIGTYRPVDVVVHMHPLQTVKQELQLHGHCQELALEVFSEAAIAEYLTVRLGPSVRAQHAVPLQTLIRTLHRRTEGNPLFLAAMVEDLITCNVIVQTDAGWKVQEERVREDRIPDSIRQLVALQSRRLSPEVQQILAVASIAGLEFSAAAVAVALATEAVTIERQCEQLAERQQFLRRVGIEEWPDGTLAARYSFLHAVYQQLWHERVSPIQLQHYHLRIGERKEQAYGNRARVIAAALAIHFEQGRDYPKAVQYLQQAGENAIRCSAYQEATTHFTKGLELLKTFPDSPARLRKELTLRLALGNAMVPTMGYIAADVENNYTRARELCQKLGEIRQLFSVLESLVIFHFNRGELQTAHSLAKQMLQLAQQNQDQLPISVAYGAMGWTSYLFGELRSAQSHLEAAIALPDSLKQSHTVALNTADLRVECLTFAAWTLWALGYPDLGLDRIEKALALARSLSHPFSLAFALGCAAFFYVFCRREQIAQEYAEAAIALSTEQGFPHWMAFGTMVRGWALTQQGLVQEGLTQMNESRALFLRPVLLAEAFRKVGQIKEGLAVLTKALAFIEANGMRVWGAELYRLKGELLLTQEGFRLQASGFREKTEETEKCFLQAITVAQKQQAKSLELRAVMSLVRLRQQQAEAHAPRNTHHEARHKLNEAHRMLAEVYHWFTEGFDTKDLQEAKALIKELSH